LIFVLYKGVQEAFLHGQSHSEVVKSQHQKDKISFKIGFMKIVFSRFSQRDNTNTDK